MLQFYVPSLDDSKFFSRGRDPLSPFLFLSLFLIWLLLPRKLNKFCFYCYIVCWERKIDAICHLFSSFSLNLRVKKVSRCVVFIMSFFIWLLWNDQIIMIKKSSILDFVLAFSYFLTTVFLKKIWTGIWQN